MVKLCPRCGSIMVPTRKKNAVYLKCQKCGYESIVKAEKYGVKYQVETEKRVSTAVASEARESKFTPEDREELREYYEIFLEEFEKESEEPEE